MKHLLTIFLLIGTIVFVLFGAFAIVFVTEKIEIKLPKVSNIISKIIKVIERIFLAMAILIALIGAYIGAYQSLWGK